MVSMILHMEFDCQVLLTKDSVKHFGKGNVFHRYQPVEKRIGNFPTKVNG